MQARRRPPRTSSASDESAMEVARRALAVARQAIAEPEKKIFQLSTQTTNFLAGTVTQLAPLTQGVTSANRIGDKVLLQRIKMQMKYYALVPSDTTFRFLLVRPLASSAATISGGSNPLFLTDDTMAQRDVRFDATYQILKDETHTLNASFLNGDCCGNLSWDINLGGLPCFFQGAATGYERGGLYLVILNDVADSASPVSKPAIGDTGVLYRTDIVFTDA